MCLCLGELADELVLEDKQREGQDYGVPLQRYHQVRLIFNQYYLSITLIFLTDFNFTYIYIYILVKKRHCVRFMLDVRSFREISCKIISRKLLHSLKKSF